MTGVAEARRLFSPENTYLNTAFYGLSPRASWEAMTAALDEWRHGRTGFDGWDRSVDASRRSWARLMGVGAQAVAIGRHAFVPGRRARTDARPEPHDRAAPVGPLIS